MQQQKYGAAKCICGFVTFLFKYMYLLCILIENYGYMLWKILL